MNKQYKNQSIRCVNNKYLCWQFMRTQPIFMQNRDQNFTQKFHLSVLDKIGNLGRASAAHGVMAI